MLRLDKLTLRIAGHPLLQEASLHLPAGGRYGLVGRNGTGKTSLLRLIQGELQPDEGLIRLRRGARIGVVAQEAPSGGASPLETVLAFDRERHRLMEEADTATDPMRIAEVQTRLADIAAHAAPARAAAILKGLGFDDAAQTQPLSSFSGGWRMRVALAGVLFSEPDLLLLDEPTNHLDLEATLWLEEHLRSYPYTLLIVSHDRDLLNRVPDRIVHLFGRKLTLYAGGFDAFERTRREQLTLLGKARAKQEAKRRHMQAFVDRFRYQANKARQAQSRLKALARLEPLPEIENDPEVVLAFPATTIPAPPLITLEDVRAGYGDHVVLDRLDLRLDPDDRIALLGANGNGKSTFAKLIAGRLDPLSGTITRARQLRVGYFAQHQIEELEPERTALAHLADILPNEREERLRARLGRFGLSQDKGQRRAGDLSGGEKARLTLALMSARDPQILILDEPTNHLDIDSRAALVEALNNFPGAVLLISHDRHLIELTADRLWLVADGRVAPYDGDLDTYRAELLAARRGGDAPAAAPMPEAAREPDPPVVAREPVRRDSAGRRARLAPLREAARTAERTLERLTAEKAALAGRLADPATYHAEGAALEAMMRRAAELEALIAKAEQRWLAAAEAVESAEA